MLLKKITFQDFCVCADGVFMTNKSQNPTHTYQLCVFAAVVLSYGCKPAGQGKVEAVTPTAKAELANSEPYDQEPMQKFEDDEYNVSTCSYEERTERNQCDKVKLEIKVADVTKGDDLDNDSLTGKSQEKIDLAVSLEADGSKFQDAVRDSARFKIGFRSLPEKAKSDSQGATGTVTWTPKAAASGTFDVVVRDVGRCIVETAYSKKGKLSEDKADKCQDLDGDDEFSEFDEVKTVSFTIEKGALEEKKELILKQIDAQCKNGALTGIISGVPGLLSGNPNAIVGVGAQTLMSNLECKSAKEKVELEFEAAKLTL